MGISQQKFGELLGFAPKWARMRISELERGDKPISRRTAMICAMLGNQKKGRRTIK